MILGRIKAFLLAAALAALPFQGMAATLSVLLCHGEPQAHAGHAGHVQENHAHGGSGHHHDDAGGDAPAGSGGLYHLCCHFVVTAPATLSAPPAPSRFPVLALAPHPLHDLFVPDRPQRPPLA